MKTKKLILLAIFAMLMLSCNGNEIMHCDFSEVEKQLIPYQKGQVYSFIDATGKTIDIPVVRVETRWPKSRDDSERDYYTFRSDIVELNSEQDNLNIHFRFDADDCILKRGYNEIVFSVVHYGASSVFILRSNAEGILLGEYDEGVIVNTSFRESIEINSKVYYDVIEQSFVTNNNTSVQLFYNKTYGILQINRGGENFLTLNPETEESKSGMQKTALLDDEETDSQPPANDGKENNNDDMLKSLELAAETVDTQSIDFVIYPNPTNGNFTVKITGEVQPYALQIFNHSGILLETVPCKDETVTLNRTNLNRGTYYVKISMNGKIAVKKIIVQ